MEKCSHGKFASDPCYVTWEAGEKCWRWDAPSWFRQLGFYSLASFIANKLEIILWMRFWEHKRMDPRNNRSGKIYIVNENVTETLNRKRLLEDWWREQQWDKREKHLRELVALVEGLNKQ